MDPSLEKVGAQVAEVGCAVVMATGLVVVLVVSVLGLCCMGTAIGYVAVDVLTGDRPHAPSTDRSRTTESLSVQEAP